ncbi:MAG: LysR substrate-binding domain-containing protein [Erysipelotrichaceae bacterium]|jgi:DNA-binding transcriptional LysR family regulator
MDFNKLQSFLVLAEVKNFTKAADQLYLSQPALTKQIQTLENELGVTLFNRVGKSTFLTVEGEMLVNYAKQTIAAYNNALEHIRQIQNLEEGTLNFGATNFIGVYLMPEIISRFKKKYPKITINMTINSSTNILKKLHLNQLEFAFISDYITQDTDRYEINKYKHDELQLIVGKNHRLFGKTSCSIKDLKDEIYITKAPDSSQYKFIDSLLKSENFVFENKLFIGQQEAIKESVIHNLGISFISTKAIQREVLHGDLWPLRIDEFDLEREIQCVKLKDISLSPAAKEFMKMVKAQQ